MKNEIVIKIGEDKPVSVDISENGFITHKSISPESLVDVIKNAGQKKTHHSGLLPQNTLFVSIKGDERYYALDFPEEKADLAYLNTQYNDFPIPHFVFGFTVNSFERITSVKIGITDPGPLTEKSRMYNYPFGNVSRFSLCYGMNTLPKADNLKILNNLTYHILGMPSNDDRFDEAYNKPGFSQRELMEHLRDKNQEYYYSDILTPMNTTLNNFLYREQV